MIGQDREPLNSLQFIIKLYQENKGRQSSFINQIAIENGRNKLNIIYIKAATPRVNREVCRLYISV